MAAEAHPGVELGIEVRLAFERQGPVAMRRPLLALRVEGERAQFMGDEERAAIEVQHRGPYAVTVLEGWGSTGSAPRPRRVVWVDAVGRRRRGAEHVELACS